MGSVEAGIVSARAIEVWNPNFIILVGILGGVEGDARDLGDLIAAEQIVGYEAGKSTDARAERRYEVLRSTHACVEAARNFPEEKWVLAPTIPRPDGKNVSPKIHWGVVASGEKVIADTKTVPELQNHWTKLIGIEMEAYGTARAAYTAPSRPEFLMVKGICDWANPDKNDEWQAYAADVAATYVINFLKSKPLSPHQPRLSNQLQQQESLPPSLLFYLPDRRPQKDELKETIQAYHQQYSDKKQRPLLYLMYSKANEYGRFMECLLNDFFPNNFSEYFDKSPCDHELHLMSKFSTVEELHQQILKYFENQLNVFSKEDIAKKLAKERRPIVIYAHIRNYDWKIWQDKKTSIVDGFIEFWKNWPEIRAQHPIFLVFIFFVDNAEKNTVLPFSQIKQFFRRRALKLKQELNSLKKDFPTTEEFLHKKGVNAVVLPQLESVEERDVHHWISDYKTEIEKRGGKFGHNTDILSAKIEALYEKRDAIPMRELAEELEKLFPNPTQ
jgi:nucleoside phosphorylase